MISDITGKQIEIESEEIRIRPVSSEVERLKCDNSKLLTNTDWKPEYDLRSGITETIKWFHDNLKHYKTDIYNI